MVVSRIERNFCVNRKDYFKLQHGKSFEEATKIPTAREILDEQYESLRSGFPLRVLRGSEDSLFLKEEERENHLHIIGTTGEGKSKFLEWLSRSAKVL
jgi:hypothetical protein